MDYKGPFSYGDTRTFVVVITTKRSFVSRNAIEPPRPDTEFLGTISVTKNELCMTKEDLYDEKGD
jgi:hypothetical protein